LCVLNGEGTSVTALERVTFHEKGFKKMEFINYRMTSFMVGDVILNGKSLFRNRR